MINPSQTYKTILSAFLLFAIMLPTLAQAAQCDFSLKISMSMADVHAQGCCPSENTETSSDCICCDCGFQADSSQTLPVTITVTTLKLQELTDFSLVHENKPEVSKINSPVSYSPQLRAPNIPVYLKNSVFRN